MALREKVEATYAANGGVKAFPWAEILKVIKDLLGGCTTNAAAQRWARRNPVAAKEAIETHIKPFMTGTKDRKAAVDATYEGFVSASRTELRKLGLGD